MPYYHVADPLRNPKDRFLCVAMLYDDFVRYCDTAEQFAVSSYLYDGVNKTGKGVSRTEIQEYFYYSSAPIRECRNALHLTRRQRAYALQQLARKKLVSHTGYWKGTESRYFRPGTAKYMVEQEFLLLDRNDAFYVKHRDMIDKEEMRSFTPIYGWMVREASNFDELLVLAFIVRKYRYHQGNKTQLKLSNSYIRKHTALSYYAIRKGLQGLKQKGLVELPRVAQGETRQVKLTEKLVALIRQHELLMKKAEKERERRGYRNIYALETRRRGKTMRQQVRKGDPYQSPYECYMPRRSMPTPFLEVYGGEPPEHWY